MQGYHFGLNEPTLDAIGCSIISCYFVTNVKMLCLPALRCMRSFFGIHSSQYLLNFRFTHNNPLFCDGRKAYREQRLLG